MLSDFDLELFNQRLTETKTWCAYQASLNKRLPVLKSMISELIPTDADGLLSNLTSEEQRRIAELVFSRHQEVFQSLKLTTETSSGDFLLFFPKCEFAFDGLAQSYSDGFFDFDNYPPFDTWVYYVQGDRKDCFPRTSADHIIAWIPSSYVDLVNRGLRYNPDSSLVWLSNLDEEEKKILHYEQLLNQ